MLTDPITLRGRTLPSRVLFGPHVTNLADPSRPRALSAAHVAHYRARADGGAGVVVVEVASVHPSDHPYEYAPLAARCGPGWAAVVDACAPAGAAVLAGLGHAGSQGSAAHHGSVLWAPSPVPDPAGGEVPIAMGPDEIDALVAGFAAAARVAREAGCDGVEIQAGQHSLLRQFLSGLTNHRDDAYGTDRARLLVEVLDAVRGAVGADAIVGLRLCADELAPWAGITVDEARATVARVAHLVDLVVPVRGSALTVGATRPDAHTPAGFGIDACRAVRTPGVATVLAGSVVDPETADSALADGTADLVEMTRALLAAPDLVASARVGRAPRPCVLTNQRCLVRDPQNPPLGCTVQPGVAGEPGVASDGTSLALDASIGTSITGTVIDVPILALDASDVPSLAHPVLVVGAGPAGLEAALTLARSGVAVRLVERADAPGGLLRHVATLPGRARFARLVDWYVAELAELGVTVETGTEVDVPDTGLVVLATGGRDRETAGVPIAVAVEAGTRLAPGPVVVEDPVGDGTAIALAERLAGEGREVAVVTPDVLVGPGLAATGDLVDAQRRAERLGVRRVTESRVVDHTRGAATVVDVVTGATTTLPAAVVVDASPRRAAPDPPRRRGLVVVGDALAPRTVAEAVREGRAAARGLRRRGRGCDDGDGDRAATTGTGP